MSENREDRERKGSSDSSRAPDVDDAYRYAVTHDREALERLAAVDGEDTPILLHALVQRSEGYWIVEVPEIDGLFTQALMLDEVPAMVKDAASLLTGRSEADFEVEIVSRGQS